MPAFPSIHVEGHYIGEKLRSVLDTQQQSLRELDAGVASGSSAGTGAANEGAAQTNLDAAMNSAIAAFHFIVKAHLALHDMLGSHTGHGYLLHGCLISRSAPSLGDSTAYGTKSGASRWKSLRPDVASS